MLQINVSDARVEDRIDVDNGYITVPEDADRTVQEHKVLNPDFDEELEYTPREERKE